MKHSKLKRRLRKKLRIAEFQELGFEISVNFKPNFSEADFDKFFDEFIQKVEGNRLLFGGGGNKDVLEGFVTSTKNYQSPTDEQRKEIQNYLESQLEVAKFEVGNFLDAWYDEKWKV